MSHLLQMRGLKQWKADIWKDIKVASFTDAWIETKIREHGRKKRVVASFTDAWIETTRKQSAWSRYWSHLLQMRGLKLLERANEFARTGRIFYRCVDWNKPGLPESATKVSHLLQMRGLKHWANQRPVLNHCRIFYRCVDWNTTQSGGAFYDSVASFTDAWIET